jgi:hypothetical protein
MENTYWFRYFLLCNELANSIITRQGLKRINFAECILESESGRYANDQMIVYFETADIFFANLFECDSDIVFKKNPRKLIENKRKILFQMDYPLKKICSGLMVFNNTIECKKIINLCFNGSQFILDDQILINTVIKNKNLKNIRLLNPQFFPNGLIYNLLRNKTESYIVHANHYPLKNIKKKIKYFKKHKLWFFN